MTDFRAELNGVEHTDEESYRAALKEMGLTDVVIDTVVREVKEG